MQQKIIQNRPELYSELSVVLGLEFKGLKTKYEDHKTEACQTSCINLVKHI